jgi:hypothetical protein
MTLDMATPAARRLFHEGTLALAELERNGLAVDADYLARADRAAADRVRALTAELQADDVWKLWKRSFGGRANLWSPEQLGVVLFDKMGLPSPGRTAKSGKHKTEKGLFDGVELPFVRKYIEAKEWAKARAVYFQGLSRSLADGRVHPQPRHHDGHPPGLRAGAGLRPGRVRLRRPGVQGRLRLLARRGHARLRPRRGQRHPS